MGFPILEVGYTSATTGRGDHEVHKGHVVTLGKNLRRFTPKNIFSPLFETKNMNTQNVLAVSISQHISENFCVHPFSVYVCDIIESVTTDMIQASAQRLLHFRFVF
jgi:hypothetical protein